MNSFFVRDVLGYGFVLWLVGYVLGFVFFALVPAAQIGWYVMPIGIAITIYALWNYIHTASMRDALVVGIGWALIAIVCDYLFLVLLLHPADGYYKLDVYIYYLVTLMTPALVHVLKTRANV